MKIKHVYGNVLKLDIPLTIKIRTIEEGEPGEREEPFYPDVSKGCVVILDSSYNRKIQYDAIVNGNIAHIEDNGIIGIGTYKVTVKCYDEEGNPYRYMVRDIIEICDATIDAGIEAGVEFNSETYTLDGAVFISYGGGSFEQVQADWTENDIHSKAYIKNKPTNLVEDENYVHTDNNYTNEEKEKLADLENYDDSGIRQELDGKVDKVVGKGLSTNDFTNEDKSKLSSALQSETDPTVPQWAKQPQKPTYTAQEVGALPSDTPMPVVPTNVSAFNNDAGYLTQHQDISGKEDRMNIVSVSAGTATLSADVSKYYTFVDAIETFAITLPFPTDATKVRTIVFFMTIGTTPAITFSSNIPIYYHDGFELEASKTYEVNALFNGSVWVIASVEIVVPTNNGE